MVLSGYYAFHRPKMGLPNVNDFVYNLDILCYINLSFNSFKNQALFIFFNSPGPLIPCNRRSGDATPSIA